MPEALTTPESQPATIQESTAVTQEKVSILTQETAPVQETQPTTTEAAIEKSFLETLSEDLRKEKSLSTFKNADDLAKSYLNQSKLIGKKIGDMTPEELKQVNIKMGVPESKESYDFGKIENQDDGLVNWFKDAAYEAGLPQDAAKKLVERWNNNAIESQKLMQSQIELRNEDFVKQLKSEFGAAFDPRIESAKRAVKEFGGDDLIKLLDETGLYNHPVLVRAFSKAGQTLKEGSFQDTGTTGQFGLTPAEARDKISELKSDPSFQKMQKSNDVGQKKAAFEKLEELYRIANFRH